MKLRQCMLLIIISTTFLWRAFSQECEVTWHMEPQHACFNPININLLDITFSNVFFDWVTSYGIKTNTKIA